MKRLFKNKVVEATLVKGFMVGVGLNDSNTSMILIIGPIAFEFTLPKKETKSPYEVKL